MFTEDVGPAVNSHLSAEVLTAKVEKAAKLLEVVPSIIRCASDSPGVDGFCKELIWGRLSDMGIYKDDESHRILVMNVKEGEARKFFCENGDPQIPVARFAAVWAILKGGDPNIDESTRPSEMGSTETIVEALTKSNYGQWSDERLLSHYNPECESGVIEQLQKRSSGKPFIVFKDETLGIPDVEASLRFLRECRRNRNIPTTYKFGDVLKKLYAAGDFPSVVFHECPFHPNVLLFDGYCDQCCHSWEGVSEETRQFARLVYSYNEMPKEGPTLRQFINEARRGMDDLAKDYPKVKLVFDDAKQGGQLPILRRRTATQKISDPFNSSKRW